MNFLDFLNAFFPFSYVPVNSLTHSNQGILQIYQPQQNNSLRTSKFQLDGQIARRFPSQRSLLGSIIDPIGDKLLMGMSTLSVWYTGLMPSEYRLAFKLFSGSCYGLLLIRTLECVWVLQTNPYASRTPAGRRLDALLAS